MDRRWILRGWALAAACTAACASRNDARVRSAWNAGAGDHTADQPGGAVDDPSAPSRDTPVAAPKQGWERVDEILLRTLDVLSTSPSPDVFGALATRWCEVEPIPRDTPHGRVRVCFMNPPLRVEGVALSLELSETGVVGLVALDLTAEQSADVARTARTATSHLCVGPWQEGPTGALASCALDGGSTLAIGRLADGAAGDPAQDPSVWQVSIAVLGAV